MRMQRLMWTVGIVTFAAAAIITCPAASHAQDQLRSPSSIDPILRQLPLEKERVRPDPTQGLDIPTIRGKQTVILRPAGKKPNKPDRSLIVLRIPDAFFSRTTSRPAEVFGLNLIVKYPSMSRYVEKFRSCLGWCEGKLLISLESRNKDEKSAAATRVSALHDHIARWAKWTEPLVSFNWGQPPPDYSATIDIVYKKLDRHEKHFIRNDKNGVAIELVECDPEAPSPSCTFLLPLPEQPKIQIKYTHSMDLWDDRRKVQEAVLSLIRSFYDRSASE